jgi:NADH-quinone oxidoreductase subunit L
MSAIALALVCTFLPLCAAALLLGVPSLRRSGRPAGVISVAVALTALSSSLVLFSRVLASPGLTARVTRVWLPHGTLELAQSSTSSMEIGVNLDGLSISMLVVVCFVAFCVQLFSLGYMAAEAPPDFGRYFAWQSLFLFAMNVLVIAPNVLQLFLGWELVGLVSYLLIGFYYKKPSAARAAVKAFWVTKLADMGFVAALIVLFTSTGSFEWTGTLLLAGPISLLLFIAVMGKSAQFPLHVWLPDAMEGPTPVSALLHAATMVAAGVFLVARTFPIFEQAPDTLLFMAYVGSFTALFAAVLAVLQNDIKRVLAYSTCSQLGYMVCALGAGSRVAGFFHLTTHAFFKALLFLAAGGLIHAVHSNDIRDMGGLFKKQKLTSSTFIVGALALAGMPGFSGFFSKDLILEHVLERGLYGPLAALLLAAFLTAFYMGRVIVTALFGASGPRAEHAHEAGFSMTLPLVLLAIPVLAAGFFGARLSSVYGEPIQLHASTVGVTATCLGLAGFGMSYWMFGKAQGGAALVALCAPIARFARYGAVDRSYVYLYQAVLRGSAGTIGFIDRYLVDGVMNGIAYLTLMLGTKLRRMQTGNVQDYVYAVVAGTLVLGTVAVFLY